MKAGANLLSNMTHTILAQTTSQHNAASATKMNFKTAQAIHIL
jgi:hypothetical protein